MKNAVSFLALALAFTVLTAFTSTQKNEYIGSKQCKACHSNAKMGGISYKAWEKSPHANALESLKTPEADKIAKGKAIENKECLSCHQTSAKDDGVGCESCHGAGSAYKTKHAKDLAGAAALGLELPKVADGSAEKQCKTCHNEKSPTYKGFDMKKDWPKVAHPKS